MTGDLREEIAREVLLILDSTVDLTAGSMYDRELASERLVELVLRIVRWNQIEVALDQAKSAGVAANVPKRPTMPPNDWKPEP